MQLKGRGEAHLKHKNVHWDRKQGNNRLLRNYNSVVTKKKKKKKKESSSEAQRKEKGCMQR